MPEFPTPVELKIDAGATFRIEIEYIGVDLTGYSAECHFRRTANTDQVAINISDSNGRIVFNDITNGKMQLVLSPEDTATLSGQYLYDVEITAPNGDITRLVDGLAVVAPEVTR